MKPFVRQFIETLLWSSLADDETQLDEHHGPGDLSPPALALITRECDAFEAWMDKRIGELDAFVTCSGDPRTQAAHDFCLTRNEHGAGFWDGDWTEPQASLLTEHSHTYGNVDPYIGDDGKIHTIQEDDQ